MSDQQKILYTAVGLFALGAFMAASGHRGNAVLMGLGLLCIFFGVVCGIVWIIALVFGSGKNKEWPEDH